MASNSFGNQFRITTWGESHGKAIGVVIDGCPAGLELTEEEINEALALRAPGKSPYTSPRAEPDLAEIYSGVFSGKTTGAPISIIIMNLDHRSAHYEDIKDKLRPGHANYTYLQKYGVFDYRGGGRASARETACRVAAGLVAQKLLEQFSVDCYAYLRQVADVSVSAERALRLQQQPELLAEVANTALFCPEESSEQEMMDKLEQTKIAGDSLGGTVEFVIDGMSSGLGDPVYEKLEANLAKAMLSMPASKGFELGDGFSAVTMTGASHNDSFVADSEQPLASNHAGGTLGGISTGMPVVGRVAFKPTSSIQKAQATVNLNGQATQYQLPKGSRHDPCVAIRAVPVVQAMCRLVVADALLMNLGARQENFVPNQRGE